MNEVIWEKFSFDIEAEIIDCLESGRPIKEMELFHDVMIPTEGHEISLDCVYQVFNLTSVTEAEKFKDEMIENIETMVETVELDTKELLANEAV